MSAARKQGRAPPPSCCLTRPPPPALYPQTELAAAQEELASSYLEVEHLQDELRSTNATGERAGDEMALRRGSTFAFGAGFAPMPCMAVLPPVRAFHPPPRCSQVAVCGRDLHQEQGVPGAAGAGGGRRRAPRHAVGAAVPGPRDT